MFFKADIIYNGSMERLIENVLKPRIKNALKKILPPSNRAKLRKIYWHINWKIECLAVRTFKKNVLPEFIIIGFPKCGTTALIANLRKHPDIHGPGHEPRFFTRKHVSLSEYIRQFKPNKVNGEKASIYIFEKEIMKKIREAIPGAKIIICLRDPLQAMQSFYAHRRASPIYGKSYGEEGGKINFQRLVLNDIEHAYFSNQTYHYSKYIKDNVLKYFPKKQIHVIIQERMMKNMDDEMGKVFKFLGVRSHRAKWTVFKNYNQNRQYECIDYTSENYAKAMDKLRNIYKVYNEEIFEFLGYRIEEWDRL